MELKIEIEISTVINGDFNTLFSIMDNNHHNQTEDNKEIWGLNTINQRANKSNRHIQNTLTII